MHRATKRFWRIYDSLPETTRYNANKSFSLLKEDPLHPSLHFKKVKTFWSVRIDIAHRALAVEDGDGLCGFGSANIVNMNAS